MLRSMTGHGIGQVEHAAGGCIVAEVRSVNNKHLKVNLRTSQGLSGLESAIESQVRARIRRGSVNVNVHWRDQPAVNWYCIQAPVVESYVKQLAELSKRLDIKQELRWSDLINLPGVVAESLGEADASPELEEAVLAAVGQALLGVESMRKSEGKAMAGDIQRQLEELRRLAASIGQRAPQVLAEFRQRLKQRVVSAIADALDETARLPVSAAEAVRDTDLIREVAVMTDKTDIREELVRLRSHFSQFDELLCSSESQGRRLDFLVQEMFREANTIGSKAADAEIAQGVVEIKTTLEQIRELIQNVE